MWKGRREPQLEDMLVDGLATAAAAPRWEAFAWLDEQLQDLAAPAELRLAFHTSFPTTPTGSA